MLVKKREIIIEGQDNHSFLESKCKTRRTFTTEIFVSSFDFSVKFCLESRVTRSHKSDHHHYCLRKKKGYLIFVLKAEIATFLMESKGESLFSSSNFLHCSSRQWLWRSCPVSLHGTFILVQEVVQEGEQKVVVQTSCSWIGVNCVVPDILFILAILFVSLKSRRIYVHTITMHLSLTILRHQKERQDKWTTTSCVSRLSFRVKCCSEEQTVKNTILLLCNIAAKTDWCSCIRSGRDVWHDNLDLKRELLLSVSLPPPFLQQVSTQNLYSIRTTCSST